MGGERQSGIRVPRWTWAFVVACGAIPIVALGGAIPSILGAVGATLCYAVAHDPEGKRTTQQTVLLCSAITILAWALFGLMAWLILSNAPDSAPSHRASSSSGKYRIVRENGKVVYDSRLPSKPKRPLSAVTDDERRKIYKLACRGRDEIDEGQEELDAAKEEGGLTLRLEQALKKLHQKRAEHLAYVADRFRLTAGDLQVLFEEGDGAGWDE